MNKDRTAYYLIERPFEVIYRKNSPPRPVGPHTHNASQFYFTLTDLPDVLLNDNVQNVKRGSLILIPPFCVHQLYHELNVQYERYIINLDLSWFSMIPTGKDASIQVLKELTEPKILLLCEEAQCSLIRACQQQNTQEERSPLLGAARFFDILFQITKAISSQNEIGMNTEKLSASQKLVKQVIVYINKNLEDGISVSKVAEHFYLNKDHISRVFMHHTHISLGRFILVQRIARAQEYLRSGLTVNQVQERMGYSDHAAFFKAFKGMVGISPAAYRGRFIMQDR